MTGIVAAGLAVALVAAATGAGPGGWDHAGTGTAATFSSLNGAVNALDADGPGGLLVGGAFTNAGGVTPNADYIARWDGTSWHELGATTLTGAVNAIAVSGGKVYVGGLFRDAGGDPNADYVAVWDGGAMETCVHSTAPPLERPRVCARDRRLDALRRRHVPERRRDRHRRLLSRATSSTGAPRSAVGYRLEPMTGGGVYALAADSRGRLYAGGGFVQVAGIAAANKIAYLDGGGWHALGSGPRPGGAPRRPARPQPCRRRHGRLRRHRLRRHRRDPSGRPRCEVERLGLERARLGHRRRQRLVPADGVRLRADHVGRARLRRRSVGRTQTATQRRTESRSSTERPGDRSARTAPATARSTARSTRSRRSSSGSTPAAASATPAVDPLLTLPSRRTRPAGRAPDDDAAAEAPSPADGTATGPVLVNGRASPPARSRSTRPST